MFDFIRSRFVPAFFGIAPPKRRSCSEKRLKPQTKNPRPHSELRTTPENKRNSVGVPSSIYDTVRSLRQARAMRLGALQKKLPPVHFLLLWLLAGIELSCFPVLGAGTQTIGGYNILTIEGCLFGIMTFGIVLTLNVVGELYAGSGGAYNVDSVLRRMVRGLDEELEMRMGNIDADFARRANASVGDGDECDRGGGVLMPSPMY